MALVCIAIADYHIPRTRRYSVYETRNFCFCHPPVGVEVAKYQCMRYSKAAKYLMYLLKEAPSVLHRRTKEPALRAITQP